LGFSNVFILFEREGLDLEGLSLRERKFNLRKNLLLGRNDLIFHLGGDFFLLKNDFFSLEGIPPNEGGRGLFIEKSPLSP